MDYQKYVFAKEYLKDYNGRRAAIVSALDPADADDILNDPYVASLVLESIESQMRAVNITKTWLLEELVSNHKIARHAGKITASNAALGLIGRHCDVDAFAADKVQLSGDKELIERLKKGRNVSGK